MSKKNLTEIAIVMDESGSMQSTALDAIGGFNSFIDAQKKIEGEANVTLVLFDNKYEVVYNGIPIEKITELTSDVYSPGGGTALIDAIGKTVDSVSDRIGAMDEEEKPDKIIVIVITDGEENSSRIYKGADVSKKIKEHQEREGWEIIFIGASADVLDQAEDLGIRSDRMMGYVADGAGTRGVYMGMSEAVSSYRATGSLSMPEESK